MTRYHPSGGAGSNSTVNVDDYLVANPTPAQTLLAITVAGIAASTSGRRLRFTPGRTYVTSDTFTVATGAYIEATGAYIRADPTGAGHYLARNVTEAGGGNPDITIEGGTWDPRGDVLIANANWLGHGLYFRNVDRIRIGGKGLKVQNALKWAILVADADDAQVVDVAFDTFSDGLHCHAPTKRAYVHNLRGHTGDDMVAFTTNDYPGFATSVGDHEDVTVDGLYPITSTTACALLSDPGRSFKGVTTITNLKGTVTTVAIRVVNDPVVLTATTVETLSIGGIAVSNGNYAGPLVNLNAASIGSVLVQDFAHLNTSLAIEVGPACVVTRALMVKTLRSYAGATGALVLINGTCPDVIFDGVSGAMAAGGKVLQIAGSVTRAVLGSVFTNGGDALVVQNAGTPATRVFVQNVDARGLTYGLILGATSTVNLCSVNLDAVYTFFLNSAAAIVRVYAEAVTQTSMFRPVAFTAGAVISATGESLIMDTSGADAVNAPQAGDRLRNRISGKLELYNGVAWVAAY